MDTLVIRCPNEPVAMLFEGGKSLSFLLISLPICVPELRENTDTALTCTDRAAVELHPDKMNHGMWRFCCALNINILLMATRNTVNSPVELGRLSHDLRHFYPPSKRWERLAGFLVAVQPVDSWTLKSL